MTRRPAAADRLAAGALADHLRDHHGISPAVLARTPMLGDLEDLHADVDLDGECGGWG